MLHLINHRIKCVYNVQKAAAAESNETGSTWRVSSCVKAAHQLVSYGLLTLAYANLVLYSLYTAFIGAVYALVVLSCYQCNVQHVSI